MTPLKEKAYNLLRWSEKYLKTDMIYLTKGGFWLMFGYAGQIVAGFILIVAFTRLLPKEVYGTYQFILSVGAIISAFTLSGMGTALMRSVATGAAGALSYSFKKQLTWSIGVLLAGSAVSFYYFLNGNMGLALAFFVIGVSAPFLNSFSLYRHYLEGKRLFRESAVLGIWRKPIPVITVLVTLTVTRNPIVLALVYFLSQTISMGLVYLLTAKKYPEPEQQQHELLNYSKHLSAMSIIGVAANNFDKMLIFHFLGAAPVAVYTLAQLPLTHTLKMFGIGGNLIFPKFAQRDLRTLRETISHKLYLFFIVAILAVGAYIVAAPYIFRFIFPSYPEAVFISQILILAVLTKPFMLFNQVFAAHGMRRIQHIVQISNTVIKLILLLILLPLYGLWGAVWATLATSAYWAIIASVLFYRKT